MIALTTALVGPANAGPLEDLQPGHWYAAPNSHMAPHMPPSTGDDWSGPAAIMTAWSGGAYDSRRDRLIIWGGGHHDYAGNEMYVFDVGSLSWTRLTDRSPDVGGNEASGYYPDGLPRSRHTYGYVVYVPGAFDRFCSIGGAALFPTGQVGISNVDCFDFQALNWERKANTPVAGIGAISAVDPTTGHVWQHSCGGGARLAEFDPIGDQWTPHAQDQSGWFSYNHTAAIDPVRRAFVAVGDGDVFVWDLDNPGRTAVRLSTSGATSIEGANNPGLAYDPVADRIVAYAGGADVYALDLDTGVWELHAPAPGNSVVPPRAAQNGTYGRFRYVASLNVFVTVHDINQDVYFYKLAPGAGTPQPDAGPSEPSADAGPIEPGADAGSPNSDGDGGNGSGAADDPMVSGGCAVSSQPALPAGAWAIGLLLVALGLRRRRA